jgi:hypothetical protein
MAMAYPLRTLVLRMMVHQAARCPVHCSHGHQGLRHRHRCLCPAAAQDMKCRHLVWTGAKPQGTWGHQGVGLAPTSVNRIRQQFAATAMIRRSGGCTTTAFALTVGQDSDQPSGSSS